MWFGLEFIKFGLILNVCADWNVRSVEDLAGLRPLDQEILRKNWNMADCRILGK